MRSILVIMIFIFSSSNAYSKWTYLKTNRFTQKAIEVYQNEELKDLMAFKDTGFVTLKKSNLKEHIKDDCKKNKKSLESIYKQVKLNINNSKNQCFFSYRKDKKHMILSKTFYKTSDKTKNVIKTVNILFNSNGNTKKYTEKINQFILKN